MTREQQRKMVHISPELHKRMKILAATTGTTIETLTETALEEMLKEKEQR